MKQKLWYLTAALFLLLATLKAQGSGGWVGNSPIGPIAYLEPSVPPVLTSSGEEAPSEWNSLLLPKGVSRWTFSLAGDVDSETTIVGIEWDYGFTKNLTSFSLFNWGYSLQAGNGVGHEWALYFGLLDGMGYGSESGLIVGPGVGLGHSYRKDAWALISRLTAGGTYGFKNSRWTRNRINYSLRVENRISDEWWLTLATGVTHRRLYSEDIGYCDFDYCEDESKTKFITPRLGARVRIGESTDLSFGSSTNLDYVFVGLSL